MATRQLTDLPANTSGLDTDLYHTRQGATDKSLTGLLLKDFVKWVNQDFYTVTGADTYVATEAAETAVPDDYFNGQSVSGVFTTNTGGAATINAGGLGVKSIKTAAGVDPVAGDIDGRALYKYDSSNSWFELQNPKVSGAISGLPTGYHSGGQTTWVSITDITIAAGSFRDSTDSVDIVIGEQTKEIDNTYVAGTGGGLPSSLTVTTNETYHLFAVIVGGVAGYMFDTSTVCANGVTDESVTAFRYIRASVKTDGSSEIEGYTQEGTDFTRKVITSSYSDTAPGTSAVPVTADAPIGFPVIAKIQAQLQDGASVSILVTPLSADDLVPSINFSTYNVNGGSNRADVFLNIITNSSGQYRLRSDVGAGLDASIHLTVGWTAIWENG